jgi:hypothetical protein
VAKRERKRRYSRGRSLGSPRECVRRDLRSAYEAQGETFETALRREFALGLKTLKTGESLKGARRFASGEGRHGKFQGHVTRLAAAAT